MPTHSLTASFPRTSLSLLVLLTSANAFSQISPPGSDIYVVQLTKEGGAIAVRPPTNITNRAGYDNQPWFLSDGQRLLYTSIREDRQADVYMYDGGRKTIARVTATPESEYSPTIMPTGKMISVVRVEADSTQRLWQFDLNGKNPKLILQNVKPVGYHAWGTPTRVALFVLGNPPTLQLADILTGASTIIRGNIGRSLHKIPGRESVSFVDKASEREWWIAQLDVKTKETRSLIRTLAGSEFHTWLPNGTLLMGQGSKLFAWKPGSDEGWKEIADLSQFGIRNITRLAVNARGDKLALVADDARKP